MDETITSHRGGELKKYRRIKKFIKRFNLYKNYVDSLCEEHPMHINEPHAALCNLISDTNQISEILNKLKIVTEYDRVKELYKIYTLAMNPSILRMKTKCQLDDLLCDIIKEFRRFLFGYRIIGVNNKALKLMEYDYGVMFDFFNEMDDKLRNIITCDVKCLA